MNQELQSGETVVIRFGGSLLIPDNPDATVFLQLLAVIKKFPENKFLIIIGGGGTSKKFQDILRVEGGYSNDQIDWMGIHSIRCNAQFARLLARELADPNIYNDVDELPDTLNHSVVVYGAAGPGHSSNMNAVLLAEKVGAKKILNLSNISHVYTANPKEFPDAEPLHNISWSEYQELIPDEWTPKLATPFDPVSARAAAEADLSVIIMDGSDQRSVENYFSGAEFVGTLIHP